MTRDSTDRIGAGPGEFLGHGYVGGISCVDGLVFVGDWDGFVYAVGTGTTETFRYASITHGGPGSLIQDGDNEINGIMGTREGFQPPIPEPETYALMLAGLGMVGWLARRRRAD